MKDAHGHGSTSRGSAKAEKIAMGRATDTSRIEPPRPANARFNAPTPVEDRVAAAALAQAHPKSAPVPYGHSFAAAQADLHRGRTMALPPGQENRRRS